MKKKNFINIGKSVINLEIKALNKLKNSFSNSFNLAVENIVKCQSKVILCGVGKSGLIANKIAATFHLLGHPHSIYQLAILLMEIWEVFPKKIF